MATEVLNKITLYRWSGIDWDVESDDFGNPYAIPLCPNPKCHCKLVKSGEKYNLGEYKYECVTCDFGITLNKSIEDKSRDFVNIVNSWTYKDAEIINIDGDLIRVQREEETDNDYWVDAKLSKNKKGEVQLMVLAGSKKERDKTQLFLDPKNEKLSFDQNNDHPREVFCKVKATFKSSESKISSKIIKK